MSARIQFQATVSHRGQIAPVGPSEIDASVYRDAERFQREARDVLSATWMLAGHGSMVAEPGQFLVWNGFGQSVVVARTLEGGLSAFHNVCQHRGAQLVAEGGTCPEGRFECPWHGFVYDLGGRVIGIPRRATFPPGLIDELRAPAVGVAEGAGLVWINLAGGQRADLVRWLEEIDDELAAYAMDRWRLVAAKSWTVSANWKVVVEAFSEDYHARVVHDETIPSGLEYDETQILTFARHSMMVTPLARVDYSVLASPIQHQAHAYCHYSVFPNTVFSCFPTHAQVMSMVPLDVHRTELRVWVVANPDAPPGVPRDRYDRMMTTGVDHFARIASEDIAVIERLVPTRYSAGYRANRYGGLESRLSLFHRVLDEQLTRPGGISL